MCRTMPRPGVSSSGSSPSCVEESQHDLDVVLRLLEVLLPLLLQVALTAQLNRALVDLHAAELGLESLEQELLALIVLHVVFHDSPPLLLTFGHLPRLACASSAIFRCSRSVGSLSVANFLIGESPDARLAFSKAAMSALWSLTMSSM